LNDTTTAIHAGGGTVVNTVLNTCSFKKLWL
jgi:hypothetical protein